MQLLLNHDEIAEHLARKMLSKRLKQIPVVWTNTNQYLEKTLKKYHKSRLIEIDFSHVNSLILEDVKTHKDVVTVVYKSMFRKLVRWLVDNFDFSQLTTQHLVDIVINNPNKSFIKNVGLKFTDQPTWVTLADDLNLQQPILIRNIINNENLIKTKIQSNTTFWFIDSGYTNFLHTKGKPWHRLVLNHIHHKPQQRYFPADRLSLLSSFPTPWRKERGKKILVVESSPMHYQLFSTTLTDWQNQINKALCDRDEFTIEFRPKDLNKKNRTNLYEFLSANGDEYHCVITDASVAAIESIWCGIPVITLNQHITNSVSKNSIDDIDNLYTGPIGDWLCELTYSQFSLKELQNGSAIDIIKEYHNV